MNTDKLYEFLILSKTLNYSRAAEHLYISQSVLSKHIKELEEELGTPLFFRSTHGVTLTNAGLLLARHAGTLMEQCSAAVNLARIPDLPTRGQIRIGCVLELSYASHIQIFISQFLTRYPEIRIDVTVLTEGTPDSLLRGAEYDFIFTPCDYMNLDSQVHVLPIQSHEIYAVLYPGHRLLAKSRLSLRELEGENLVLPFAQEFFGPYAKNWLLVQKYTHDKVTLTKAPNLPSALFQVSLGRGICLVPRYARNLAPQNLFTVRIANPECRFEERLYYIERTENRAARLFYEEFKEHLSRFQAREAGS